MFPLHEAILDLLEIYHVNGQEHATLYIKQLEMSSPEDIGALWAVLAALTLGD